MTDYATTVLLLEFKLTNSQRFFFILFSAAARVPKDRGPRPLPSLPGP